MARTYYTTSQAARMLSVSADTVLKWVRAGKIRSYRTPGGHARIPMEAITALLPSSAAERALMEGAGSAREEPYRYCWDFYAGPEGVGQACRDCVVYKSQARRCYEMREIPEEFGHLKLFCDSSCNDCEFYQITRQQALCALVVSRNTSWLEKLADQSDESSLELQFVASEYECAAKIEKFRPDYIVLDCSFGMARTRDICCSLARDERIPFTHIILTSRQAQWKEDCDAEIFAWIKKPFSVRQLTELVEGSTRT